MSTLRDIAVIFGILLLGFVGLRRCTPEGGPATILVSSDTVVVRDTIRDTVPVPKRITVIVTDTVWIPANDTAVVPVPMLFEKVEYKNDDYQITVGGWRPEQDSVRRFSPRLLSAEVYPTTKYITRIETSASPPRRFGVGIQAGYGFSKNGLTPYVGIGISYNLINF